MSSDSKIKNFLQELEKRLSKEMPRIKAEIKVYERKLASGKLNVSPKISPQFNG